MRVMDYSEIQSKKFSMADKTKYLLPGLAYALNADFAIAVYPPTMGDDPVVVPAVVAGVMAKLLLLVSFIVGWLML